MATWYANDSEVLRMTQDARALQELLHDAPLRLMHEAVSGNPHMTASDRRVLRAWLERAAKMKENGA